MKNTIGWIIALLFWCLCAAGCSAQVATEPPAGVACAYDYTLEHVLAQCQDAEYFLLACGAPVGDPSGGQGGCKPAQTQDGPPVTITGTARVWCCN